VTAAALVIAALVTLRAVSDGDADWQKPVAKVERGDHERGGSVRVAVSTPPEVADTGAGGNTLRSLLHPRLFEPQPDGSWRSSLVREGSDHATKDGRSAQFALDEARWSDGSSITADDLRRTQDDRFVESIEGPDEVGNIRVRFKQKLPGWRMLWSDSGIAPPRPEVSGGPFVVSSLVSGKETVLKRNDGFAGGPAFLDEVRLQYVPDAITARQLLARKEIDVVAADADTMRTSRFDTEGVRISKQHEGGRWTALQFNVANVPESTRVVAARVFPRDLFVNSLLAGEAEVYTGIDDIWRSAAPTPAHLDGVGLTFSSPVESPVGVQLDASFDRALGTVGATMRSRSTDAATVNQLVSNKTYDVAFVTHDDGPDACWQCVYANVDAELARQADSGDGDAQRSLQRKARDEAAMLPLWREFPLVAYVPANVEGVQANGYTSSAAWNAGSWWKPEP
jgi:hypothetical protein